MKSFEPMISAPLNCSRTRPSVVHPLAADRQPTAADVQHERDAALGQARPEGIVVGMAGRSTARRAGGEPHEAETHVERGVELDDRLLRHVEVADRDSVKPIVPVAEASHRPVVRSVRAVAERGVIDLEQRRAERRVHDLVLEAEEVERATPLCRLDGAQRGVPLRASLDEVVAQPDQSVALVVRVLPVARVDAVRHHHGLDVRQAVTQLRVDVIAQEARPLHEVAVRVDDAATPGVRH